MLRVANRKIIIKLALKSFRENKVRNTIAILAILLTSILFTSIFTVAVSLNVSMEQQYMRMVGGYAHGGFKYLTEDEVNQLKSHPLIKEYGSTLMLSMPTEYPFNKHHTELRYGDDNGAKMYFSYPAKGRMPKDKMELATDTTVLDLLGVPHKIGEKITLTYNLGGKKITDTFTLCGFWQTDEAGQASQVWLSKEYVTEKLKGYEPGNGEYAVIGTWSLDLMFADSSNIEEDIKTVAEDNGFSIDDKSSPNYVEIGVNWAYTSTHMDNGGTISIFAGVFFLMLLITFTGYLIIYNIFQISVANDTRYYGLIKTIGTTSRQVKRLVRCQAFLLSIIGIPLGLFVGFLVGSRITPIIMNVMTMKTSIISYNPWIFICSAVFTLVTVAISVRKPGKMAAGISPIEAVRYSEGNGRDKNAKRYGKKRNSNKRQRTVKKHGNGSKVYRMAIENLKLNRKKTVLVIISLSLSVILLNTTYTFTKGFNMDKFLDKFVVTDFIVGNADYFQARFGSESQKVTDSIINNIKEQGGITESGFVYGKTFLASTLISENAYRQFWSTVFKEDIDNQLQILKKENGLVEQDIELYGLEELPLNKLTVLEGNLDKLKDKSGHFIAQVVFADDYGNPEMSDAVFKVGDKMKVHYCNDYEYSEDGELTENNGWDVEYEIAATVMMPINMSLRHYGSPQFVLASDIFIADTATQNPMIFMFNVKDKQSMDKMESLLEEYTKFTEPDMNYESKASMESQFITFQNMFLLVGSILSFIIGLVGILNFINAEITSIITRRREFAMLQSIGMTGKQLKSMLIYEGIFYGCSSIFVSIILSLVSGITAVKPMENLLWFFDFRITLVPVFLVMPVFLLLGIWIPLLAYKTVNKKSIVERLRETE